MSVPSSTEFGCIDVEMLTLLEPSNDTEPEISPESSIILDVCSADAVSALPTSGAVTAAKVTEEDVSTS